MSWPLSPAAVALDALDPAQRAVADRLLADDPTFRAEVDRLRATTAALSSLDRTAWEPAPPPPLIAPAEQRRRVGWRRPSGAAGAERRRVTWRRPLAIPAALVATAALALVLVTTGRHDAAPSTTLALRALPGAGGRAELTISGADASLRATGLKPSGPHDYYEAWLADARGRMVSMGTFRASVDGRVDVHMAVAVDLDNYTLVDVSREPDDGNPAHSDTSVLRAQLQRG